MKRVHVDEWGDFSELLAALIPAWVQDAACGDADPRLFFPEQGEKARAAIAICEGCDVQTECLDYALTHSQRFGVWGGLLERQRRNLRKQAA